MTSPCECETFWVPRTLGTEDEYRWVYMEECYGPNDCGYSAIYLDEDGEEMDPGDGPCITSGEMAAAHQRHMAFAAARVKVAS